MRNEAVVILGAIFGFVVLLTILGGGNVSFGTGRSGPFAQFGYSGAYR